MQSNFQWSKALFIHSSRHSERRSVLLLNRLLQTGYDQRGSFRLQRNNESLRTPSGDSLRRVPLHQDFDLALLVCFLLLDVSMLEILAVPSFHSLRCLACAALFPPLALLLQLPLAHNQSARHGQLRRFFPIHSLDESLARSRSHSPPLHRLRVENTRLFITSIEADRCITRSVSRPLRPCSSFCFTLYSKPL